MPSAPKPLVQFIFPDEGLGHQEFAVVPVEHVKEAVAIGLEQQLARPATIVGVHQDHWFGRIPVVQIMRRELVIPFQFAGLDVQRDHAIGIEVGAAALVPSVAGKGLPTAQ